MQSQTLRATTQAHQFILTGRAADNSVSIEILTLIQHSPPFSYWRHILRLDIWSIF